MPIPRPGDFFRSYKVSKRFDQDISAVCGRSACGCRMASFATSASALAAWRRRRRVPIAVEDALIGRPWTVALFGRRRSAMDNAFAPLSDMRASAAYRRTVARNLLLKCFLETSEEAAVTRLVPA